MRRYLLAAAVVLGSITPAAAQETHSVAEEGMALAIQQLGIQARQLYPEIGRLRGAQTKLDATDAYWKAWCGSAPGCAVTEKKQ